MSTHQNSPILQTRPNRVRKTMIRTLVGLIILFLVVVLALSYYVTNQLIHPKHKPVTITPSAIGLTYKNIQFESHDGTVLLKGWEIPAPNTTHKWFITSHGYTGNRLIWPTQGHPKGEPGLEFFKFLNNHNYNVLTFDYRNSGESGGHTTTVGFYEQQDLLGAIDTILKQDPKAQIALIGWSQGAATTLLTAPQSPAVKVAIADSSFSNLGSYLNINLPKWSHLPSFPFNELILKMWVPLTIHVNPNKVSPVLEAETFHKPLLLMGSTTDPTIPFKNSQAIYAATKSIEDVTLDTFTGPGHTMEFVDQPATYEKELLDFLNKHHF